MSISVTEPIDRAWKRMFQILFQPFKLSKWFGLGFCFFLAYLGRDGGGSFNVNVPSGGGGGTPSTTPVPPPGQGVPTPQPGAHPPVGPGSGSGIGTPHAPGATGQQVPTPGDWFTYDWVLDNIYLIIGWTAVGFVVLSVIWALVIWLRSRGVFMMMDGLAFNRGLVVEPWKKYREAGNSLFKFSLVLALILTLIVLATFAIAGYIAWPDFKNQAFGTPSIWAIIVLVVVLPLAVVNVGIIEMLLLDFIAPTMYLRGVRVRAGWGILVPRGF